MTSESRQLDSYLRSVRSRLQRDTRLRSSAWISIGLVLLTVACVAAGIAAQFSVTSLHTLRAVWIAGAVFGLGFLVWRFRRGPHDLGIARFVEERRPDLQQRLVTAVEMRSEAETHPFGGLLMRDAVAHASRIPSDTLVDGARTRHWWMAAGGGILLLILMLGWGPAPFRYGAARLFAGWIRDTTRPLYSIDVRPGNVKVGKRMDQEIGARLNGFDSEDVTLLVRFANQVNWEEIRMVRDRSGSSHLYVLEDIQEPLVYRVRAGGIQSDQYSIDVGDWPTVESISQTLRFPAYTGMKVQTLEGQGDIEALKGTHAELRVRLTQDAAAASIRLESGATVTMKKIGKAFFAGNLKVEKDDSYWIEVQAGPAGNVRASDLYSIHSIEDQPPVIRFTRPGRDVRVTALEEIVAEASAEDDFGIRDMELRFSVNGGAEQSVPLYGPGSSRTATGQHTFFLEEFHLEPGDFINYYARARDGVRTTNSDVYFLEVQPFSREYKQSQQAGGAGQGGGDEEDPVLSRRQKEILAGTWRLAKNPEQFSAAELAENSRTLGLLQQKLQTQAQELIGRLKRRNAENAEEPIRKMLENLEKAVESMTPAHKSLAQAKPSEAVTPEQKSLQHLMRAEAQLKEMMVAFGNSSGGQGGQQRAEELAELMNLELDKMKNQYETLQQNQARQRDSQVDEAARKLKELAQRQQQMEERQRRQQQSGSTGGAGADQRNLQKETEELARQLERLSREKQDTQMGNVAQQLRQAARQMQEQSRNGQGQSGAEAASEQLRQARDRLGRMQQNQNASQMQKLQQQAGELAREQQQIVKQVEGFQQRAQQGQQPNEREISKALMEKEDVRRRLESLEQSLHAEARRMASDQKDAAQRLQQAGNGIRDGRLKDKMREGSQLLARGQFERAREREAAIGRELEQLQQRISEAERKVGPGQQARQEKMQKALQEAGELLDRLESLQERLSQQGRPGAQQGRQGEQQGRPGEQQGRQGERGQPSEQSGNQEQQQSGQSSQNQRGSQPGQQPGSGQRGQQQRGQPSPSGQSGQSEGGSQGQGGEGQSGGRTNPSPNLGEGGLQISGGTASVGPNGGIDPRRIAGERQLQQELRDRVGEAQRLRQSLAGQPELRRQLEGLLGELERLDARKLPVDQEEIDRLRTHIIKGFRELELKLSLKMQSGAEADNVRLFNPQDVPPEYRKMVEDYYRSLADRKKPKK